MARLGAARPGKAGQGSRRGAAGLGQAGPCKARIAAGLGAARLGQAWRGKARLGWVVTYVATLFIYKESWFTSFDIPATWWLA